MVRAGPHRRYPRTQQQSSAPCNGAEFGVIVCMKFVRCPAQKPLEGERRQSRRPSAAAEPGQPCSDPGTAARRHPPSAASKNSAVAKQPPPGLGQRGWGQPCFPFPPLSPPPFLGFSWERYAALLLFPIFRQIPVAFRPFGGRLASACVLRIIFV